MQQDLALSHLHTSPHFVLHSSPHAHAFTSQHLALQSHIHAFASAHLVLQAASQVHFSISVHLQTSPHFTLHSVPHLHTFEQLTSFADTVPKAIKRAIMAIKILFMIKSFNQIINNINVSQWEGKIVSRSYVRGGGEVSERGVIVNDLF